MLENIDKVILLPMINKVMFLLDYIEMVCNIDNAILPVTVQETLGLQSLGGGGGVAPYVSLHKPTMDLSPYN